jgi:hypothetical protein
MSWTVHPGVVVDFFSRRRLDVRGDLHPSECDARRAREPRTRLAHRYCGNAGRAFGPM